MKTEPANGARRRVVIYTRISDDREGRRYGVRRQERDCRKLAEELGVDVVEVLVENDISAYSGKPRPKYDRMLKMLRAGQADGVLALTSRRLQRRYREAFDFLDLVEEKNLLVATVKGGTYDLTTADGRREARRKAVDDQHEAEEIAERVRDAKKDNLREGTYRGGPRPFGYERDGVTPRSLRCPQCPAKDGFIIDREDAPDTGDFIVTTTCGECGAEAEIAEGSEAWHLGKAIDAIIAGDSLRSVCREWAEKGVRTVPRRKRTEDGGRTEPVAREWQATELRRTLLRPRNAGLIDHRGEIVGKAAWPPLTTEDKWRAVKGILEQPERRTTPGNARKWLGSGIYRCGALVTLYRAADGREFVHTGQYTDDEMAWPLYAAAEAPGGQRWTPPELEASFGKLKAAKVEPEPEGRRGCRETLRCSTSGTGAERKHLVAYRCRSAVHVTRTAELLDGYVEAVVVERLSSPDAVSLFAPTPDKGESTEHLATRANTLRAKLDQYSADYADDLITRKQMIDGTARARAKLAEIEAEMERRATVPVLARLPLGTPEIGKAWEGYTLERKRAILDAIMEVTVLPSRRGRPKGFKPGTGQVYFDPEYVRIKWKTPN
ncbi:recombinase family protein [Streptomyces torulosus]|uniref:recombinase family protein n=1 Tax=Streptomyces torulosus TaxID=68276 RepID=UPI0006EB2D30|nr:recombinase family protein [Streptomyces torulosus]